MTLMLVLLLWHHFYLFTTYFGYDDMHYAGLANQISKGLFSVNEDHYTYRWGYLFPLGLAYFLFGVTDFAGALVSIGFTLGAVYVLVKVLRDKGWLVIVSALGLLLLQEFVFFYSDKLMPDIGVMSAVSVALYLLSKRDIVVTQRKYSTLFAISVVYAFLIKETIILVLPLFLFWMVSDIIQKKNRQYWVNAILVGLVSLIIYFVFCKVNYGSYFSRFTIIQSNAYDNACSFDTLPLSHLLERIGYGLWKIFYTTKVLLVLPFLIANLYAIAVWKHKEETFVYWNWSAIILLLLANFMTISWSDYIPMCGDIRHFLYVSPCLAIAAMVRISDFDTQKTKLWWTIVMISTLLLVIIGWVFALQNTMFYVLLLIIGGLCYFVINKGEKEVNRVLMLGLCILFCIQLWQLKDEKKAYTYKEQKLLVERNFKDVSKKIVVLTNPVEVNIGNYLLGFDTSFVQYRKYDQFSVTDIRLANEVIFVVNGITNYLSGIGYEDMPTYIREPKKPLIVRDSLRGIIYYEIEKSEIEK